MSMSSVNDLTKPLRLQLDPPPKVLEGSINFGAMLPSGSPKPLDLSANGSAGSAFSAVTPAAAQQRHCSVIQNAFNRSMNQSLLMPMNPKKTDVILPQCTNANLNSNWIAMKFGAAVGPNRMSYPREFKLMVIDYFYANGQNKYRTCKEFQITKSMLNGWLSKIDKIRSSRPGSLKSGRSGRRPQFPDVEKQLFELYQAHLASGQKQVGNRWIRDTARKLAQQQCSAEELAGMCQFSERWLSNFKKRYGINLNKDWTGSCASSTSGSDLTPNDSNVTTSTASDCASSAEDLQSNSSESHKDDELTSPFHKQHDEPMQHVEEPQALNLKSESVVACSTGIEERHAVQYPRGVSLFEFYRQYPWLHRKQHNGMTYEPGRRGRKVQFPQVERVLYERLKQRQMAGDRISNRWLQEEARTLAAELCPEVLAEATKSARCMFSEHWLHNFKKRYAVSLKEHNQSVSQSHEARDANAGRAMRATDSRPVVAGDLAQPTNLNAATLMQMQQWLVQQYYLSSLAAAAIRNQVDSASPHTMPSPDSAGSSSLNIKDDHQQIEPISP